MHAHCCELWGCFVLHAEVKLCRAVAPGSSSAELHCCSVKGQKKKHTAGFETHCWSLCDDSESLRDDCPSRNDGQQKNMWFPPSPKDSWHWCVSGHSTVAYETFTLLKGLGAGPCVACPQPLAGWTWALVAPPTSLSGLLSVCLHNETGSECYEAALVSPGSHDSATQDRLKELLWTDGVSLMLLRDQGLTSRLHMSSHVKTSKSSCCQLWCLLYIVQ